MIYTSKSVDIVLPFEARKLKIRGRLVRLDAVVSTVLDRHAYPPLVSRLLAEALGVTAALGGAALKEDDSILSFQLTGDGPIGLLVADYVAPGILRGYARFEMAEVLLLSERLAGAIPTLDDCLGDGRMSITLDSVGRHDRYQGIVELKGDSVTECVTGYFKQSEQTLSHIMSCVEPPTDTTGWRVGILMIQRIPSVLPGAGLIDVSQEVAAEDDAWGTAMALLQTVSNGELVGDITGSHLIHNLFHNQNHKIYQSFEPEFGCRCSRDRVVTTLTQFPSCQVKEMVQDGRIVVNCQFCNASFMFTEAQIAALISQGNVG